MIDTYLEMRFDTISTGSGDDVRICCPFCYKRVGREDTKYHLYVSLVKPVAHCFRCEYKCSHVELIMNLENVTYTEALALLGGKIECKPNILKFDDVMSRLEKELNLVSPGGLKKVPQASMPDGFINLSQPCGGMPNEANLVYNYARNRFAKVGLNVKDYEDILGWVPGTFRLWILVDEHFWQGRAILDDEYKYISPPWPKGDTIYNIEALDKFNEVYIVEGFFSAVAVGNNAMAILGKSLTGLQAERVVRRGKKCKRINLMFDANVSLNSSNNAADLLKSMGYNGEIVVSVLSKGDPFDWKCLHSNIVVNEYIYDFGSKVSVMLGI